MDMSGTPCVLVILPRVGARLYCHKLVKTILVSQCPPSAAEVRVQWSGVIVFVMKISSGCIRLPNFNKSATQRPAAIIKHLAPYDNAFAKRVSRVLAREVVIAFFHILMAV